ncbi:hypothetical protein NMG60_11028077 [Bertholletia excelsa]
MLIKFFNIALIFKSVPPSSSFVIEVRVLSEREWLLPLNLLPSFFPPLFDHQYLLLSSSVFRHSDSSSSFALKSQSFGRQEDTAAVMSLSKELVFLILQYCHEEDLQKTAHMLELETSIFFDMDYFEDLLLSGNWDEAEKYLLGFTILEDNKYSTKIYFEMRKQKFLEALDEHDRQRALDILLKDLKAFSESNEELYKEMTQLLSADDFRKHGTLSFYGDTVSARQCMVNELKVIIKANPLFQDKLKFPEISNSRLRRLINQSLNWQHIQCSYPQQNPDINTLFVDHQCPIPDLPHGQSLESNPLGYSTASQSVVSDGPASLCASVNPVAECSVLISETNSSGALDEVIPATNFPVQIQNSEVNKRDDLPKSVQRVLTESSSPTSVDFHPVQQNLLLVGTNDGNIGLWDISSGEKVFSRTFRVWKIKNISKLFLVSLVKDPHVSVNHISWCPDGSLFGVAYSKYMVQLYSYHGGSSVHRHLEIDAHAGSVNDLAFSKPKNHLFLITCGDDKFIQVWDATTGAKQYTFEGHGNPVYSVCPHEKEGVHFIFSTSTNGEIKAWLYDKMGPRVAYDTPGYCRTRMVYSSDGKRLFSCGTSKDGESCIFEWNESEGYVKRSYQGLGKCSSGVMKLDTSQNQFLVAGDDHLVKVWDMDYTQLLTTIDADGDLPASPYVCFNKGGSLMAVTANNNKIKILATPVGHELLQTSENVSFNAVTVLSETIRKLAVNPISPAIDAGPKEVPSVLGSPGKNGDAGNSEDTKPELTAKTNEVFKVWKCKPEVRECLHFQSLRLPSEVKVNKISRLIYTNIGNAILALASNGIHLLWKWSRNEINCSGMATTKVCPQIWQPRSGLLMTNNLPGVTSTEVFPCFALSKNDSYVVSASGAMISLFNMISFKKITAFLSPPPVATCITFYPQDNNIIAIGTDNSTILIYHVRTDVVIKMLEHHCKRVTGLAFSDKLNLLVSSGADAQIVVWNTNGWEKQNSKMLPIAVGKSPSPPSYIYVQFHQDQKHFLSVHESQLAIYDAIELKCVTQWTIGDSYVQISNATFSCNSQLVYAGFVDGTVLIFNASDFNLQCVINPTSYLPSDISIEVYPIAIASHPQEPNQFALGLTDGAVVIMEPLESPGKWC